MSWVGSLVLNIYFSVLCVLPPAGDLPLPVVRLLSSMRSCDRKLVNVEDAGPGFTLPENMGDLGPAMTVLDLRNSNLIGTVAAVIL